MKKGGIGIWDLGFGDEGRKRIQPILFQSDSIVVRFLGSKQYRRNIEEESKENRKKPHKGTSQR